jgi:hypothetical protein
MRIQYRGNAQYETHVGWTSCAVQAASPREAEERTLAALKGRDSRVMLRALRAAGISGK